MSTVTENVAAAVPGEEPEGRLARHGRLKAESLLRNGGGRRWSAWKAAAVDDLVALADKSPRTDIFQIDLEGDLSMVYGIRMPVPRWPVGDKLVIGNAVVFHLLYLDAWRTEPIPPTGPIGFFQPIDIFHPNARPAMRGALCLGPELPPGIPPVELVLLGYYSLTLQTYNLDETDYAGLFNPEASEFLRSHAAEYLPLTRAGLYDDWQPEPESKTSHIGT